jgi:hypothetical protein
MNDLAKKKLKKEGRWGESASRGRRRSFVYPTSI